VPDSRRQVRLLLVDDHAIVRQGLKLVLAAEDNIEVIGEAEDGRQAVELVAKLRPDVVVMDIAMPELNGFEATRQIKQRFPEVQVVILTMHEDPTYYLQIVRVGAVGCVLKRSMGKELLNAVEAAARGESYLPPTMAATVLEDYRRLASRPALEEEQPLSAREREVLQFIAEGKTSREIADVLGLSPKTIQAHRANILTKIHAHSHSDLLMYAIRSGMIQPD